MEWHSVGIKTPQGMEWYNMANVLIVKKSSSVTVKKSDTTVPSKRLVVQEIPVTLSDESISVLLDQVEEINVTL
jgi:hypothetical protein